MKKYFPAILLFALLAAFLSASAQQLIKGVSSIDDIAKAIRKGSSSELATYFSRTLDLTVPDNEGSYSSSQAEMILKNFFTKYPPKTFVINNRSGAKSETQFAIGQLSSGKDVFRVFFMIKEVAGKSCIQQFKIEK